jgi:Xaa-Pro dipeptidase
VRPSGDVAAVGRDATARLRELKLDRGRIGLVSGDGVMDELPYTLYDQLRGDLPEVAFSDTRKLTMDLRLIKSPAEFALLEQSARVADAAVEAAGGVIAPGIGEYALVSAAEATARAAGADGYLVAIAGRGTQELIGPPEDKPIEPGAVVIVEVAVQVDGYWTQVARAFVAGEPTAEQHAIYETVYRAYSSAVDAVSIGKPLGVVAEAAYAVLNAAGYADYIEHDVGHGIGLDLPEPPSVQVGADLPIREGMVLVLHPAVRVPGVGGAFIGGTVLVAQDGPVAIHQIPERLT